ncbi:hypothetical protein lse_0759 [Listeria seeligeri serovar 1/2b str. SLCC3954]|nr:hypothetical protein lse_0759 [Listeria seeligeri serovar 1/2b str. SLCC3954]
MQSFIFLKLFLTLLLNYKTFAILGINFYNRIKKKNGGGRNEKSNDARYC